ncbi:MAG: N-acetyltransferase family protein [Actinomycetota bacterium]
MIDVRPLATADEYDAVLPLIADYQRFYEVEDIDSERNRAFFRRFLAPSDDGLLVGAWDDGALIGFTCLVWTFSSLHAAEIVLLADLLVAAEARGRGVGRALIDAAVEAGRARGAHHVEWLTHIDNRRAQRLYESVGAERSAWFGYEIPLREGPPASPGDGSPAAAPEI